MKSMTGYGRGECAIGGLKITVEISSVNRKQSEISISLPRPLDSLETQIREVINQTVARGKLTVRIALQEAESQTTARVHLNEPLARAYAHEFRKLAKDLGLEDAVSLETILRAPGVLQPPEDLADAESLWPSVETALKHALSTLVAMRLTEGEHLKADMTGRITLIRKSTARISKESPKAIVRYREQLRDRIAKAGLEKPDPNDERLIKEVVYFADRSDITEELTRLQSHFKQFEKYLQSAEPVGRSLDFLSQEMNREANTIGSKANDQAIAGEVVKVKAELEKLREQAQNVE